MVLLFVWCREKGRAEKEKKEGESEDTCTAHVAVTLFWRKCTPSYFVLSLSLSLSLNLFCMCVGLLVIVSVLRDE